MLQALFACCLQDTCTPCGKHRQPQGDIGRERQKLLSDELNNAVSAEEEL